MLHTERTFEEAIEISLLENGGYTKGISANFSRELALDKTTFFAFIKATQPKSWEKLVGIHGSENQAETKVLGRLLSELDFRGSLDVLRNGFVDYGVLLHLAFFKPESGLNPETLALYEQNILTVTRQVYYSTKNENSLDMVLGVNGLPVATIELKNPFTGQNVENAKKQYQYDRDPRELIFQFKKRTLVHFAVDPDQVFMATKLEGGKTKYLPFNLGYKKGAGNPPNSDGYKTSYLWEKVLVKDSFMDLLGKFLHLQSTDYIVDGVKHTKESLIFPRFHQLDVVRKLGQDCLQNGAGKNYLIQHSAGSGKSNSIAWLAYRLSSLHDKQDKRVFDTVIVITDRRVLDQQLQNTIYQFEHKSGVVQKIDEDSKQLADALDKGINIVITTLHKFPYVIEHLKKSETILPDRKYALIVDEAHSSQGGEAASKMKQVLAAKSLEEAEKEEQKEEQSEVDFNDRIADVAKFRGKQSNLSFFAFTATPKAKTLEVFGDKDETGKPQPFHLYSMRQAIEEGFILDVLKNYSSYETYYKLSKQIEDDPEFNKKKAAKAIGRFLSLHPHNLAQKTEIIVEHFRQVVAHKIGGKAKAMIVTGSRLHAVRYYLEFQKYILEKGYQDIKALVAFSGKVIDPDLPGTEYMESVLNGFKEKELPEKFDSSEYQLLIVADKYQTGFDQPLLHTMYVDKVISGVKAVQTLSRLNRTCAGKEDTFILDFANDPAEIVASFQDYYESTALTENTDPNHLYDLKTKLDQAQVYWQSEIESFCQVFFTRPEAQNAKDQAKLYAFIDPAIDRFNNIADIEAKDEFKHQLTSFVRLYSFLSQIMPFYDVGLEKLYAYSRLLQTKLPKDSTTGFKLDDEVALEYYRLQKISEGSLVLEKEGGLLDPITEAGIRKEKEEKAKLSDIIKLVNEKLGTDFTDTDRLFWDQVVDDCKQDENLEKQAKTNTIENFKFAFEEKFVDKTIERNEQNRDMFKEFMDDKEFKDLITDWALKKVYDELRVKS
jgi:type I restriction enzyme R subunit